MMCLLKKWYKINVCSGMSNNECVATDIKLKGKHNAPTNEKPVEGCGAWVGDLIIFVGPEVGHLTDVVLPGDGKFESFFARRGDIWLPTWAKKTATEHLFPTSTLHACAVRFERSGSHGGQ